MDYDALLAQALAMPAPFVRNIPHSEEQPMTQLLVFTKEGKVLRGCFVSCDQVRSASALIVTGGTRAIMSDPDAVRINFLEQDRAGTGPTRRPDAPPAHQGLSRPTPPPAGTPETVPAGAPSQPLNASQLGNR